MLRSLVGSEMCIRDSCEAALTLPLISAPFPTILLEHLLKVELYGPDYLSASSSHSNTNNNNLNAQQLLSMSGIHDNNSVMDPNTMMMSVEQIAARGKLSIPGSISRSIAGDTIASEITGAGRVLAKLLRSLGLYADPSLLADPTSIHPIVRKVMGSALPHYLQSFIESHLHSGCLLYTSDAADEEDSVDLGGRRIIKKKKRHRTLRQMNN
eukprot:TRINITY_DN12197_c0_g1_i2.p1 TRINITY_DN12197_c0_g1~~TRINITY_DN12197_c0_g1_i2.p1  ORF type:complete len:211 (-),score=46.59 TRINITY_DN12197_c0_g1_i2:50-682(-)